jgi:hypothetical protein
MLSEAKHLADISAYFSEMLHFVQHDIALQRNTFYNSTTDGRRFHSWVACSKA